MHESCRHIGGLPGRLSYKTLTNQPPCPAVPRRGPKAGNTHKNVILGNLDRQNMLLIWQNPQPYSRRMDAAPVGRPAADF
jgi:hypothetical protein